MRLQLYELLRLLDSQQSRSQRQQGTGCDGSHVAILVLHAASDCLIHGLADLSVKGSLDFAEHQDQRLVMRSAP